MRATIKAKLAGAFTFLLLITATLGIFGITNMSDINEKSTELSQNWMPSIDAIHRINTATGDLRIAQYTHVVSTDPAVMRTAEGQIDSILNDIATQRARYEKLISSDEERQMYQAFEGKFDRYLKEGDRFIALSRANQNVEAAATLADSRTLYDDFSGDLLKLVKLNTEGGAQASAEGDVAYADARNLFVVLLVVAVIAGIAAAIWISLTISRGLIKDLVDTVNRMTANLRQTAALAETIAQGDLTVQHTALSDEDKLGHALIAMVERLRIVVADTVAAIGNVAAGSQELSSSSEQVSQGATEQAAAAVSEQRADAQPRVLLSFAARDGRLCRAWRDSGRGGIACRDSVGWKIERKLLLESTGTAEYRQAGSDTDLLAAAQTMAAGEALDADAERRAKTERWIRPRDPALCYESN
ncbi:MCP four helix bundle domain-containing protein [Blastomonas sp. UPD001]|uniref:MCP four helix bundle domain-containing protein n=1 Tax=Blastomonas sp. UPD001 TaxID=2217673 RepID=UPI000E345C08|nr:MCP four helix bundle domain-containing protein [Blastomonas sp. UPD001]